MATGSDSTALAKRDLPAALAYNLNLFEHGAQQS